MSQVLVVKKYKYTQSIASATWTITHNLNITSPVVDAWVITSPLTPLTKATPVDIRYLNAGTVVLTFDTPYTGVALVA